MIKGAWIWSPISKNLQQSTKIEVGKRKKIKKIETRTSESVAKDRKKERIV